MNQFRLFKYLMSLVLSFSFVSSYAQGKEYVIKTIAFYNLENLFDIYDDPDTFDEDRTPTGKDLWTQEKYNDKLFKMSRVISEIGTDKAGIPPVILGLCELENRLVLEDLISQPSLSPFNYGIIHYDSPDRRGVDVALLYQKDAFQPQFSQSRRLILYEKDEPTKRVFTRDQLVVSGYLDGELIYFIVNHWPSRSGGEAKSSYRREDAARLNKKIIDSIRDLSPFAKIITMGDFNDDPTNKSIKKIIGTVSKKENISPEEFFNPMETMHKKGLGTLAFRDGWNLFDQIILSQPFVNGNYSSHQFYQAGIFNPDYLLTPSGQFKGYPFRSYDYGGYTGGYSDHFPVYIYLIKEKASTSSDSKK